MNFFHNVETSSYGSCRLDDVVLCTGRLVLEDLGGRNGTHVNGRRVERTHLSEGDRIGIGAATFEVRDGWLLNF